MILCICIHRVRTKTAQIPWKIRSNSWENFTHYYLFTCCIVVNVIVWEIGRGKQAAGQSRAPGRVMWTKCLPRDTIQPMESTLRNSNEIICKHRNLRLQVPGKVVAECGLRLTWSGGQHRIRKSWNLYTCISLRRIKFTDFTLLYIKKDWMYHECWISAYFLHNNATPILALHFMRLHTCIYQFTVTLSEWHLSF